VTIRQRRVLGGVGAVVAVVAAVLLLTRTPGDERLEVRGRAELAPTTTATAPPAAATDTASPSDPGTTVPLVPVTTGVPVPEATEPPPPTMPPSATPGSPRTTAGPAAGEAVSGAGAVLTRSTSGATRVVDKADGCYSAAGEGWKVQECGALRTSGTVLLWLVETKGKGIRALVLKEQADGRWAVVLSAADVDGTAVSRIGVRGADVSGDGQPELTFGFHRRDPAATLAVDVVDASPAVVVHRDLAGGSARVAPGELTTWAAAADGVDQVSIRWTAGAWRATPPQRVERSSVPPSMV
jgi:hypothetical protein